MFAECTVYLGGEKEGDKWVEAFNSRRNFVHILLLTVSSRVKSPLFEPDLQPLYLLASEET